MALTKAVASHGHRVVRFDLAYRRAGKRPPKALASIPGFKSELDEVQAIFGGSWVAGGRSYGGRVASMLAAEGADLVGLVFLGYPLHRPGNSSDPRIEHWPQISVPSLFIQGSRDAFCDLGVLEKSLSRLGARSELHVIEGGDHSFRVPKARAESATPEVVAKVVTDFLSGFGV